MRSHTVAFSRPRDGLLPLIALLGVCSTVVTSLHAEDVARKPVATQASIESPAAKTQLERLRELETLQMASVERTKSAFVFLKSIQGGRRASGIASGSGFCISPDGYVLTNNHVIAQADEVQAFMTGGRFFRAEVVGRDPMGDIALVKLEDASDLPYLEFGDSSKLRPGQRVFALGDPFLIGSDPVFSSGAPPNFEPAVSTGIVSAVHRYSEMYNDAIQVDLAVNRGNSGGPLLTLDGKVVGVNGKIEVRFYVGINTGVGYAVPSNQIARFLEPLRQAKGGVVMHGFIRGLKVGQRTEDNPGLPIVAVEDDSPAAKAGFQRGDFLLRVGGRPVPTRSRYLGTLGTYPAGERVEATIARGERQFDLTAVLVAPGSAYLGLVPQSVTEEPAGVRVKSVVKSGPADRAGLREGDIIVAFAGEKIETTAHLKTQLRKWRPGDEVPVTVLRVDRKVDLQLLIGGNAE